MVLLNRFWLRFQTTTAFITGMLEQLNLSSNFANIPRTSLLKMLFVLTPACNNLPATNLIQLHVLTGISQYNITGNN